MPVAAREAAAPGCRETSSQRTMNSTALKISLQRTRGSLPNVTARGILEQVFGTGSRALRRTM